MNHKREPRRVNQVILNALATIFLTACGSVAVVQTGQSRAPVTPAEVKVYLDAPASSYETIAMLTGSDTTLFRGRQHLEDSLIKELKAKAARLGANGVFIKDTAMDQIEGRYKNADQQTIKAFAIYVK